MHKPMLAAMVFLAALCSCSGDDTTADATTTMSVATPATPATDAVVATVLTQPRTTAAPTTTTTTTTTTVPPPTVEVQIAADYQLTYDGYWACLRAPLNCDTSWLVTNSGSAQAMQATMQALFDRGRYLGEENTGYYVVESITVGTDRTTAEIITCWWSTAVLYGPPADPSRPVGPDNWATVAADVPVSGRQLDRLRLVDARWRVEGSDALDEGSRTNICAPESEP